MPALDVCVCVRVYVLLTLELWIHVAFPCKDMPFLIKTKAWWGILNEAWL